MKVHELIEKLKTMPQDASVHIEYDTYTTWERVNYVWLSKLGIVVVSDGTIGQEDEAEWDEEKLKDEIKSYIGSY